MRYRIANAALRFLLIVPIVLLLSGASKQPITSLDQLAQPGAKIAVALDTPAEETLARDYPDAKLIPYTDKMLAYTDVANGRLDAYVDARVEMEFAIQRGFKGVRLLDENYAINRIAVAISPVTPIPALRQKLNAFIRESKADGTLDDMFERWVIRDEETMPDIPPAENPTFTLRVGTTGTVIPYSYFIGPDLAGYDVELAHRFASWLGAKLELKVFDFGSIIAAAERGNVDCIMSNLFYSEEKDESIPFSDVLFEVEMTAMVRDDGHAAGGDAQPATGSSLEAYNGRRIAVTTGSVFDAIVQKALPDANIVYFNSVGDMIAALEAGKIDAFAVDEPAARQIIAENPRLTLADGRLDTFEFGFALPRTDEGDALRAELDAWLATMKESGALQRVFEKWTDGPEARKTLPDYRAFPAAMGTLTLATEGAYAPLDYFRGNEIVGVEIDLAAQFCEARGYGLRVETMGFDAVLPAVQSGKADFAAAGLSITEERLGSVYFSEPYYTGGTVLVGRTRVGAGQRYERLADLEDKRIGVTKGSVQAMRAADRFPNTRLCYFSNTVDLLNALRASKIDAFADAITLVKYMMAENPDLTYIDEPLGQTTQAGAIFPKTEAGKRLRDEYSAFIRKLRASGEFDEIQDAWFSGEGSIDGLEDLPATNGTLRAATDTSIVPFTFIKEGKPAGLEIDLAVRFCREKGYGLKIVQMDFAGIIPAIVTGKVDFACCGVSYTPERAQSVLYSEPTHESCTVLAVLKREEATTPAESSPSFRDRIASSVNKTFIREDRWRLFAQGVYNTLVITLLSILIGTALGFAIYILCRNGNPVANLITRISLWLVQGMPMVVLLMILYYIIFGSIAINGIVVAVMGFTLTFGASVFGMLKMGVGAVDAGQYEAAYALGYSRRRTFYRIILPQALPHVMPSYKSDIVSLIKATAVVGYIAVQDLTKMGDIVRSRTYEAFFPLIAVTVIYFLLEGCLRILVSRITISLDFRRRKPEAILKGVKTEERE